MNDQPTRSSRFGEWLGSHWRKYCGFEKRITLWLTGQGVPEAVTTCLKWGAYLGLIFVALSLLFGAALVIGLSFMVRRILERETGQDETSVFGKEDHRSGVFYDPINYNDTDDPRFEDD
jgi:hypothetical protein